MFNYYESKKRVYDILNSKTKIEKKDYIPSNDSEFTYENGIKAWVGAMFLDIKESSKLFKKYNEEKLARILRAYFSEIVGILKLNNNYRQIGIRGDCVYAIYSVSTKDDLKKIFSDSILINTFNKMFQKILVNSNFVSFEIGIGLGLSETLIVKTGQKFSGINDNVWIGESVVDASKLSGQGNRDGFETIVMNELFFNNIKEFNANPEHNYSYYISSKYSYKSQSIVYQCDMINIHYNKWIDGGMK